MAGIVVKNASPGLPRTPISDGLPEAMLEQVAAHSALGRLETPEEIADGAVWLLNDEARFIIGQSLLVDVGFNIAGWR
ncbi:hypothetical protein C3941_15565 [Kaistia algarum]|uniref:SDR family oxidoreductase n=1 Tax=Kaistia algarum TaxID=2083279 RepID=UPI000CE8D922|nr:SDR family oxidoreductase [Kaistia algarum]MCX5514492.1 SDR family oxidoreductase [Kaistia algarum]PPE79219.1 hypothetical protein C3941_15565 [Kaistia algarum]